MHIKFIREPFYFYQEKTAVFIKLKTELITFEKNP